MAKGMIAGALAGLGGATQKVGIEAMRAAILAQRDERLNAYASMRDEKRMAHSSAENAANRDLTREQGAESRRVTQEEGQKGREHASNLQLTSIEHAARMAAEGRLHTSQEAALTREHQASEGAKSRAIQGAQLDIMAKGAALDREIKTITLENAQEAQKLRKEYKTETDPAKRLQIEQNLQILTGKDNDSFLPVPLKDETGAITGYQIFDKKRGVFVTTPGSSKTPSASDIEGLKTRAKDPRAIAFFESQFGAGSAAKYAGGAAPAAGDKPAPKAANPASGLQAQLDFDDDAKSMSPQALLAKYGPLEAQLKADQMLKLAEIRKSVPKRVPLIGG